MHRIRTGLAGLALGVSAAALAATPPAAKVIVTQKDFAIASDPVVACAGTVNGFITLPHPVTGPHRLAAAWVRPDGIIQDNSDDTVTFPATGAQTARVWLDFGGEGGLASTVRDDATAPASFNGTWRVRIRFDDAPLIEQDFKVKC